MRVAFAFSGFGRGEYPDHSKFQPDDLLAPDIIAEALKRQGLEATSGIQGKVRAALDIEGIIPANVTKDRDRLRAAGQTPAPYIPDEYLVTLTLPRKTMFSSRQCELLLGEIATVFTEKFRRNYGDTPAGFGSAFDSLRKADYFEYDLLLSADIQNVISFLNQQQDIAKTFRSPTTNLTFSDLLSQAKLFLQIRLSETLGLIRQNGLSSNRSIAVEKMNYNIRRLNDAEQEAIEEQKVVDDLLAKTQARSENYVLGIKSQATQLRPEAPILDQGLIDSLLENDASNFLVHKALEAGLAVKRIQSEKIQLLERRKEMDAFLNKNGDDQTAVIARVQQSLAEMERAYDELISNIRITYSDFVRQQFADAIRVSMAPVSGSTYRPMAIASAVGGLIGLALGMGLSLLGIYVGEKDVKNAGK